MKFYFNYEMMNDCFQRYVQTYEIATTVDVSFCTIQKPGVLLQVKPLNILPLNICTYVYIYMSYEQRFITKGHIATYTNY